MAKRDRVVDLTETKYGFRWGPVLIERRASHNGGVCLGITTPDGKTRNLWVSAAGRTCELSEVSTGDKALFSEPEGPNAPTITRMMRLA